MKPPHCAAVPKLLQSQMEGDGPAWPLASAGTQETVTAWSRQKLARGRVRWPGLSLGQNVRETGPVGPGSSRSLGLSPSLLRALRESLLSTDAQKFKTKFEECRKEIEEKEKKGDAVLVGGSLLADSLCTWLQSQAGAFFVCHRNIPEYWYCLDLSRVTQLPWDTVLFGEGAGCPSHKCMLAGLALWHLGR